MSDSKEVSLTEGKIYLPLIKFTVPIFLALVLQAMYGAVDMIVVGHFGTAADVSAVSSGSQILQMVTFVIVSLSMGTTVLIGLKIGAKENDAVLMRYLTSDWDRHLSVCSGLALLMDLQILMCGLQKLWTTLLSAAQKNLIDQGTVAVCCFICGSGFAFHCCHTMCSAACSAGLARFKNGTLLITVGDCNAWLNIFGRLVTGVADAFILGAAGAAICD